MTVQANAALVEGILDNLIDNALRYGGRTITIELAGRTLAVVDDGPGIASDVQRDLMQRWAQGPAGQKLGQGAGLGLAIVARYAALLGAQLRFDKATRSGRAAGQRGLSPDRAVERSGQRRIVDVALRAAAVEGGLVPGD